MTCHYCPADTDLRPYGPGGTDVCFECATQSPEREAVAQAAFEAQMEAAAAMSPVGAIIINPGGGGPEPLVPEDLGLN